MNKNPKKKQADTKILFRDEIDTPYPYCVVPKINHPGLTEQIQKNKDNSVNSPRNLLSVTTWDGRELFQLRSFRG